MESVSNCRQICHYHSLACGIQFLVELGYRPMAVSGGEEAVEYLRDNTAALLLIDMVMEQGMNGYETYRKILELHPEQKAVITSGNAESDPIEKTLSLGAGSFISKPFSSDELGVAVRNELKPESDDLV